MRVQTKVAMKRSLVLKVSFPIAHFGFERENSPDDSAQTSNGSKHGQASLEQNNPALRDDVARLAIKHAPVIPTVSRRHGIAVLGASRSGSRKGGEPEDDEDGVDDEHCNDVVELVQAGNLFRQDNVQDGDPGEQGLGVWMLVLRAVVGESCVTYDGEREAFFVEVGVVHHARAEGEDDEGDEHRDAAQDGDPDWGPEDVIRHALFVLWCLHCEVLSSLRAKIIV
jgi:hypothetical protein